MERDDGSAALKRMPSDEYRPVKAKTSAWVSYPSMDAVGTAVNTPADTGRGHAGAD